MGSVMDSTKPLVLIGCTPVSGHISPVRTIAKDLVTRGYEVTFVSSSHFRESVEAVGCTYVSLEGYADFWDADLQTKFAARMELAPGPPQLAYDLEHCFVRAIPDHFVAMQKALRMLNEQHPGRPIVQVSEGVFWGGLPITQGAKGIKPTATLGIGIIPLSLNSIDTAPFGPGLLPPTSQEEREKYQAMSQQVQQLFFGKPQEVWMEIYKELGASSSGSFLDAPFLFNDRFLQMCIPSAEYPRSDAPKSVDFAGGVPKGSRDPMKNPPTWWNEVAENKEKKDIIFVSQGTVNLGYSDLTIPTMEALKDRPNTLLVVALGLKGASLPEETKIPENARIADFLPFDEVLPHCAAFVTNGGYGGFQHGISNGTPILVAGEGEDKPEVAARIEWSGIGVNLHTKTPTIEDVRKGVDEVISNPKYKKRALEMQAEMASYDSISIVARTIDELGAGIPLK